MSLAIPPGTDLSTIPLAPNPNGSPPNFINPPNLIGTVQGVGITLAIIAGILLCLRLRIYTQMNKRLLLDDCKHHYRRFEKRLTISDFLIISYSMALVYTGLASTRK
jgi:hypothetical protein